MAKPVVVAIQGTEHRLTGTADAQYNEWRDLLRQIFVEESGFVPDDLSVYAGEPEPARPREDPLPGVALKLPASGIPSAADAAGAPTGAAPDAASEASPASAEGTSASSPGSNSAQPAPASEAAAPAESAANATSSAANGG